MSDDGFQTGRPNFTPEQRQQLADMGVSDEQLRQLRGVLQVIQTCVGEQQQQAAIRVRLGEIEKLAATLSRKLYATNPSTDQAISMLDSHLWLAEQQRGGCAARPAVNIGKHVSDVYLPRLHELMEAAKAESAKVPGGKRGRSNTASWRPVEAIDTALHTGWLEMHQHDNPRYPEVWKPNKSNSSTFYNIVCVCYEAVGGNPYPEKAFRAFLKYRRDHPKIWP